MSIMNDLETIAQTKMPVHEFRLSLQRVSRLGSDVDVISAAIASTSFPDAPKKAKQVSDGFKSLLGRYSSPARVMNDYKVLVNAYGYCKHQLSQRDS